MVDGEGLGPLLDQLSSFSWIFAFEGNIKEGILFEKSLLENAAADLLKSISMVVKEKVFSRSTHALQPSCFELI